MRWMRKAEADQHPGTSRQQLNDKHDAFSDAHRTLSVRLEGHPEDEVRTALSRLLKRHGQRISNTELELWTLEIAEPDWATKDPSRAARIMAQLSEEPGSPGEPGR